MPIYCDRCADEIRASLDKLSKREVVQLLEKAVLDGKIRDTTLFTFEGTHRLTGDPVFTTEERDILFSYYLGGNGKIENRKEGLRPEI